MTWGDDVSSAVGDRRTTRGTRTVRVGRLDVAVAGAPVWVVIGPVRDDAGSRAGEVLDRMAALGPRSRVGLQPSPDTTRWNFTDKPSLSATPTIDISGCTTTQEILDRVVGRPPAGPISVGQAGEHQAIPLAEVCEVLVDLRRFLPDEAQTRSNFCTVARVHAGDGTSYENFSAQLRARAESPGTLVKLAGHVALARAFRAPRRKRDQARRTVVGSLKSRSAVQLTISDISKMPAVAKLVWTRPADAETAVSLPPGSSSHLSIALRVTGNGAVQVSATFAAALLHPDTVRNALRRAFTAENLCVAQESPRSAVKSAVA